MQTCTTIVGSVPIIRVKSNASELSSRELKTARRTAAQQLLTGRAPTRTHNVERKTHSFIHSIATDDLPVASGQLAALGLQSHTTAYCLLPTAERDYARGDTKRDLGLQARTSMPDPGLSKHVHEASKVIATNSDHHR